ncbi:MAG: ornithine cyclodeaminase family protein [Thermaerobacterales bacterium]
MGLADTLRRGVLLLGSAELKQCLELGQVIEAVSEAYADDYRGESVLPPVVHLTVDEHEGEIDVKTGYLPRLGVVAVKVAAGFFRNEAEFGLPSGSGTIVLLDASSGYPLAVLEGDYITQIRTGAAGAIGARHLARRDSSVAFVLGAGAQGQIQTMGLAQVLPNLKEIRVYDQLPEKAQAFKETISAQTGLDVIPVASIESGVRTADVVVTATPSRAPQIQREWLKAGTHINAIGADGPGKQELDPTIFRDAGKVVPDSWRQASHLGECQHGVAAGYLAADGSTIHAEIGQIVAGHRSGRDHDGELTVFDSTGMGVQDVAAAGLAYRSAIELGLGQFFRLNDRL